MDNCIFCKIAKKEMPKEFTYEDEEIVVFPDIKPFKPVHLLIVPKKHIKELLDADPILIEKMTRVVQQMIRREGLQNRGYRLIVNGGGAQIIDHLHIHLTGPWGKAVQM